MKPRNKYEKHIVENLVPRLSKINQKQIDYAIEKTLLKRGAVSRGKFCCLECGHKWDSGLKKDWQVRVAESSPVCPECDQKLHLFNYNKTYHTENGVLLIVDRVKDYQVVRYLWTEKRMMKGSKPLYQFAKEVIQHWVGPDGTITTMARSVNGMMGHRLESWNWGSEISIKDTSNGLQYRYSPGYNAIYPNWKLTPTLRRNGMKRNLHNVDPETLFSQLITNPIVETLIKSQNKGLLPFACYREKDKVKKYWSSVKICMRNNYKIDNPGDWIDHLELLEHFGKDLHNSKYVCPENFNKEHQKYIRKKAEQNRKMKIDKLIKKISKEEPIFQMQKGHFFGVLFEDKDLKISALKSINDFLTEADILGHCVFVNEYYKKKDSLILSARIEGELIETIEIDLSRMEIVQSRGRNNNESKYNSRIRKLVEKNLHVIQELHIKNAA